MSRRRTVLAIVVSAPLLLCSLAAEPARSVPPAVAAVPLAIDWQLSPAAIAATCKAEIATADARITAMTRARSARTFSTVVAPLEAAFADLDDRTVAQTFLTYVSTDRAVRDASQQCTVDESAFGAEVSARPELFTALKAARDSGTASDEAQRKLTELWITQSQRAGAALGDADRKQFVALSGRLSQLETSFGANLANEAVTVKLSPAQIAGLPPDFVATFKRDGDAYIVPVDESTIAPLMQNASDASARRAYDIAYQKRGGTRNVELLQTAIGLRAQLAHLLGYPTYAAYVLADKMAQSPQRASSFLANLDTAILPKARQEWARLAALKGARLDPWDVSYEQNILRKREYAVDTQEIKRYFPVQHTVDAVLAIYSRLLGVRMERLASAHPYNDEVTMYSVRDAANGVLLGTFGLDLYPRPGKYDHFANFPIVSRRVLADGTVRAPLAFVVGNWSRPASGTPALLTHDEVVTFFHEFGHNMAAMLADTPYATLNSGFRSDFVEAPSQMLENFTWNPAILKQISSNVDTGAPLPDALIEKLVASRYVDYALATTSQILYATVDLAYHTQTPPVDTTAVWKATLTRVTPGTFIDGTLPQAAFGHLMSGYEAGYYGYLWSKVYAQDMFSAFAADGVESAAVGRRYRDDILAPARMREPDAEVAAFLGRPMSPTAFYSEFGVAPQTSRR